MPQLKNFGKQPKLVVTTQQSRFHIDATNIPTSKEIEVKDLSLVIGGRDLLTHANLVLHENRHYVLVGRNGTGKSTLMRAIAEQQVPGIASALYILLLGQTSFVNSRSETSTTMSRSCSVLEHVLRSDSRREKALAESQDLSQALENAKDASMVVQAIRKLKHARLQAQYEEAARIAARRSGARGINARKALLAVKDQVATSQALLEQPSKELDPITIEQETRAAVDTLAEIQASLEAMDSAGADARARTVLLGLGFSPEAIDSPFTALSGGWRTRCSLACALFQKSDVLLLDECTNFLDLPAVIWLQGYIQSLTDTTVVLITHDRDFADAVAQELIVLREQGLEYFKGNLSLYEHERHSKIRYFTRMQAAQDKKTKHIESSIASALSAAKRTGDDKKLKQVSSRRKKLEERTGLEVGLKGGRFKLNRDLGGYHLTNRAAINIPTVDPPVKISIPSEPPDLRFPGALVSLENVSFSYGGAVKAPILRGVNLVIHPGERVGVVGLNGTGKSTLVGLVIGADYRDEDGRQVGLRPTRGTVTKHPRVKIACFSQHAVEVLEEKGNKYRDLTALQEMTELTAGQMTEQEVRGILSSLGLQGKLVSEVPIAGLSGGQKVRLALAKLIYQPPHLLVLDEVTTHLDSDTILALVEALKAYRGALMVVTHDRFFMRCVVEGEKVDERPEDSDEEESEDEDMEWEAKPGVVYRIVKGELKVLSGGVAQYETIAEKRANRLAFG